MLLWSFILPSIGINYSEPDSAKIGRQDLILVLHASIQGLVR